MVTLLALLLPALATAARIWQLSSESVPVSFLSSEAMPVRVDGLSDCSDPVTDFTIALWLSYDFLPQTNEFFLLHIDSRNSIILSKSHKKEKEITVDVKAGGQTYSLAKHAHETKSWEHVTVVVANSVQSLMVCVTKWNEETKCHNGPMGVKLPPFDMSTATVYLGGTAMELLNAHIILSSNSETDVARIAQASSQTSPRWSCEDGTCASPKIREAECVGSRLIKFAESVKPGKMNMYEIPVTANSTIVTLNLLVTSGDADLYARLPATAKKQHVFSSRRKGSDIIKLNFNAALFDNVESLSVIVKGFSDKISDYTLFVEEFFPVIYSENKPIKGENRKSVDRKVMEKFEFRSKKRNSAREDGEFMQYGLLTYVVFAAVLLAGAALAL